MKLILSVPGGTLEIEGTTQKELIKQAAFFGSLPSVCPVCESATRFSFREPEGYEYYGLVCEQGHELKFGQHKEGGTLFPKGEWTKFDGQKEVVLHRNGQSTLAGADAAVSMASYEEGARLMGDDERMIQEKAARKILDDLGVSLYDKNWTEVRTKNIEKLTAGVATSPSELKLDEINRLIGGLNTIKQRRAGVKA
jgi:hypothetical protein